MKFFVLFCLLFFGIGCNEKKDIKSKYSDQLGTREVAMSLHFSISGLVEGNDLRYQNLIELSNGEGVDLYVSVNSAYFSGEDLTEGEGTEWRVISVIKSKKGYLYVWSVWPDVHLMSDVNF